MTQPAAPTPDDRPYKADKPTDDREEVYYHDSPSPLAALSQFVAFGLLAIILIVAPFVIAHLGQPVPGWAYAVAILIALILLVIPWLRVHSIRYRISNYRIDFERGLLGKRIDTLELWHIEDLSFSQSVVERICGLGSITVVSHDVSSPRLSLIGVRGGRKIFDTLEQRIIAVKRQRGVLKMDAG
jgi:uncharacterized membrane protein YdbT with pleckstrin-like domain